MNLNLPRPGPKYDQNNEASAREAMQSADAQNMKIRADVNISKRRLILQSPDGSLWSVVVSNLGVITATAI